MSEPNTSNPQERYITPTYNGRGRPRWRSVTSAPDNSVAVCLAEPRHAIPVIFVPGVMGSNLKPLTGNKAVWLLDSSGSMANWLAKGPSARKAILRPEITTVFPGGKVSEDTPYPPEELRRRGWGEVGYMSYGDYLAQLHRQLHGDTDCIHRRGPRFELVGKALGAEKGEQAISQEDVLHSYRLYLPVHAFGYNWLQDNKESARLLGLRINDVIRRYVKEEGKHCTQVILVTHSMGGLVARYCSELFNYRSKILGIVHGVMPAIAAAVYRRMKAGPRVAAPSPRCWGKMPQK